ncbi:hypothetical protein [Bdellovibrio sp. HCB274]|uniref:hypothetical protein n=1 Tax=Bdellovibrio sp. HCB274 TaxID=3394361 RepID=UPI0039B370E4
MKTWQEYIPKKKWMMGLIFLGGMPNQPQSHFSSSPMAALRIPGPLTAQPVFSSKTAEIYLSRMNLAQKLFSVAAAVPAGVDAEITPALYRCMTQQTRELGKMIDLDPKKIMPRRIFMTFVETFDEAGAANCTSMTNRIDKNAIQFLVCFDHSRMNSCRALTSEDFKKELKNVEAQTAERESAHGEFVKAMDTLLNKVSN